MALKRKASWAVSTIALTTSLSSSATTGAFPFALCFIPKTYNTFHCNHNNKIRNNIYAQSNRNTGKIYSYNYASSSAFQHNHHRFCTNTVRGGSSSSSDNTNSNSQFEGSQEQDQKYVQDALYRIGCVNYMPDDIRKILIPFHVDSIALGKVHPSIAELLVQYKIDGGEDSVFELSTTDDGCQSLTMSTACGSTCAERSQAVAMVMEHLRERGVVQGWRNELYPVAQQFYHSPIFLMERAAVSLLGVLEYGVHINGLVLQKPQSQTKESSQQSESTEDTFSLPPVKMWIARRSATKSKYPNMLDHVVAGGQPAGISLLDNVVKECLEEAGIPESISRSGMIPVGAISYETYCTESHFISRNILFCFDLYLPPSFQPTAVDGEVQEFYLWTVPQLLESLAPNYHDPIKPNCYVVIIDWLLRNGHFSPDVPGYLDILTKLRSGACQ